jgi:hypothetical protein
MKNTFYGNRGVYFKKALIIETIYNILLKKTGVSYGMRNSMKQSAVHPILPTGDGCVMYKQLENHD